MSNQKEKEGQENYIEFLRFLQTQLFTLNIILWSHVVKHTSCKKKYWLHEDEMIFIASCLGQDMH